MAKNCRPSPPRRPKRRRSPSITSWSAKKSAPKRSMPRPKRSASNNLLSLNAKGAPITRRPLCHALFRALCSLEGEIPAHRLRRDLHTAVAIEILSAYRRRAELIRKFPAQRRKFAPKAAVGKDQRNISARRIELAVQKVAVRHEDIPRRRLRSKRLWISRKLLKTTVMC